MPRTRKQLWPSIVFLAVVVLVCQLVATSVSQAHPDGSYPRTFNLDWRNDINAAMNSRYDVVVVSSRLQNEKLDSLRILNPSIKRLITLSWYIYYNAGPSGYPADWGPFPADDPAFGWDRKFWDLLQENDWWLYGRDSSGVRYRGAVWWEAWTGNFSSKCPPNAQGQRLCDVFADYLIDNLVNERSVDGLFFDNCWDSPIFLHWQMWGACQSGTDCKDPSTPKTPETEFFVGFDMDNDGNADDPDSLQTWWFQGVEIVMNRLRERMGSQFVLVGNGRHHFAAMNGAMYERFPRIHGKLDPEPNPLRWKWHDNVESSTIGYLGFSELFYSQPRYNMIDTEHPRLNEYEADNTSYRLALKRWTLGTTLLGDGYYTAHGPYYVDLWWEPEYDLRLGWPLGPAYTVSLEGETIWRRDFSNGQVWVNPTDTWIDETETNPMIPRRDAVILEDTVSVGGGSPPPSSILSMESPWPNPTTSSSSLRFRIDPGAPASLRIFDLAGRLVKHVWTGVGTGDTQTAIWDGTYERGYDAPPGVYFALLSSSEKTVETRLVRLP